MNVKPQPRSLQDVSQQPVREANLPTVTMGFGNLQSFELMQRAAKMLTHSTLVPVAYRALSEVKEFGKVVGYEDNRNGLPNCVVALNMAQRMGADPLMVMQNLYIVEGRPSWSSQFIIAAINSCGRYSPLRFEMTVASEPTEVTYNATEWQDPPNGGRAKKVVVQKKVTVRHQSCVAWATEKASGERLESPRISVQMAIDEGWLTKNGSKWQTMPEVMLRYRAAAFFGKLYAPELLMGLQTAEEATDVVDVAPDGSYSVSTTLDELRGTRAPAADVVPPEANENGSSPQSDPDRASISEGIGTMVIDDIREDLERADTVEQVDFARSGIAALTDETAKAELLALASARIRAIAQPEHLPAEQTPTTTRRARAPISAE